MPKIKGFKKEIMDFTEEIIAFLEDTEFKFNVYSQFYIIYSQVLK